MYLDRSVYNVKMNVLLLIAILWKYGMDSGEYGNSSWVIVPYKEVQ